MKQTISIFLLILLTWQTLFKTGFIVYWKINQNEITQTLCENRDKPKMHCDGKCYLRKQLNKVEGNTDDKKNVSVSILKLKSVDNFVIHSYNFDIPKHIIKAGQNKSLTNAVFSLLKGYQNALLRPPEFI